MKIFVKFANIHINYYVAEQVQSSKRDKNTYLALVNNSKALTALLLRQQLRSYSKVNILHIRYCLSGKNPLFTLDRSIVQLND